MNKKKLAITFLLLFFLIQISRCYAVDGEITKEVERIEVGQSSQTIFYTDGSNKTILFLFGSAGIRFSASSASTIHPLPPSPIVLPIDEIMKILKEIVRNFGMREVGSIFLARQIYEILKRPRRGRPRDYWSVDW